MHIIWFGNLLRGHVNDMLTGGGFMSACLSEDRLSFVLLRGDRHSPKAGWERGWGHVKYMTPAVGWGHARLAARQTPGGKPPWCGISIAAGPRRSKVAEMTAKSALRASPGLRGRRVFLIEPQRSGESLILISGDRNPIFRGDSWESGSPCVREMTVSP